MAGKRKKPAESKKKTSPGELEELRARLQEAEETLQAIRSGAVDAIVVSGKAGEQVYTLQGADQSYRHLVESINEGIVTLSEDGTILYSNKQFAGMLGYSLEKIIGSSFFNFIAKSDRHQLQEALRSDAQEISRFEALLNSYEWGKIPARITLSVADLAGTGALMAVVTDLSEQIRYREIVREEKLSRSIMENSPDGIAVCDLNGVVVRASRALLLCSASAQMKPFDKVFRVEIPAENGPPSLFSVRDVLAGKSLANAEALLHCSGKKVRDISISAAPLRNDDHAVMGCLITMTDITERKATEDALRLNDARFLSVLNNSLDVIYRVNTQTGRYEYMSPSAERVAGFSLEELMAQDVKTALSLIHPEDLPEVQAAMARLPETGREEVEYRQRSKNGDYRWLSNHMSLTREAAGRPLYRNGNIRDITEQKNTQTAREEQAMLLEEQARLLEEANRELESFSYSVSHDLKAPIRAIDGYSRMILKKYEDQIGEDAARMLGVIRTSTERMVRLIDDLLSFSRVLRNSLTIVEIDMNKLVSEVWADTEALRQNREMKIKITKLLPGFGDRGLIRQVLFNLISNAVKFTRDRMPGSVEISCSSEPGQVVYCLKDNGVGFDMAYYHKLFNVFQRLHSADEFEGTGAGLAIVSRIIKRHGGRVWAEGEVDKGACFYFSLPDRSE